MSCCPRCALQEEVDRLESSPLLATGGFAIYRGLFDSATLGGLLDEALAGSRRLDQLAPGFDKEQVRGGEPARAVYSVEGGPLQTMLFTSHDLGAFVAGQTNAPVRPSGMRATYSIYCGDGSYLGLHRDVPGCDLALITCLHDSDANAEGGALDAWLDDLTTPLGAIRNGSAEGRRSRVVLAPRDALLLHGGVVPHSIPTLQRDRLRIVSLMCYEVVGGKPETAALRHKRRGSHVGSDWVGRRLS